MLSENIQKIPISTHIKKSKHFLNATYLILLFRRFELHSFFLFHIPKEQTQDKSSHATETGAPDNHPQVTHQPNQSILLLFLKLNQTPGKGACHVPPSTHRRLKLRTRCPVYRSNAALKSHTLLSPFTGERLLNIN